MKKRRSSSRRSPSRSTPAPKVWAGRFAGKPSPLMEAFSCSVDADRRMWREEIEVDVAWLGALRRAGILTAAAERRLRRALRTVEDEFRGDRFVFLPSDEDIHVAVERRLTELAGPAGRKIHTGRSRNDQVVTEFRLWLKRRTDDLAGGIVEVIEVVVEQADATIDLIVPAYTHNQQAQPIRMAHYLLSLFWALARHHEQVAQCRERLDECPLGCGAVTGTSLAIDRRALARDLGFARVSPNSVDATGNRSFVSEMAFICADICTTLSRYSADFIVWCSREFDLMDPGELFATGSSMMPNKKNPDAFELVRGKAARVQGAVAALLSLQKGIPATYARDLQEDKPPAMDAVETAFACLRVFAGALASSRFVERVIDPDLCATDVADFLTRAGVPFRDAHARVGEALRLAAERGVSLAELPARERRRLLGVAAPGDLPLDPVTSVEARQATGGTARKSVTAQLRRARTWLERHS